MILVTNVRNHSEASVCWEKNALKRQIPKFPGATVELFSPRAEDFYHYSLSSVNIPGIINF